MSGHSISRRSFLQTTAVAAGAMAVGQLALAQPAAAATTFYKGADISWVPQLESEGTYWCNASGARQDILTILKGYGLSAIRLRTWVHPADGHCSITETAAMAVRVKNAGMDGEHRLPLRRHVELGRRAEPAGGVEEHVLQPDAQCDEELREQQHDGDQERRGDADLGADRQRDQLGHLPPGGQRGEPGADDRAAQRRARRGQAGLPQRDRDDSPGAAAEVRLHDDVLQRASAGTAASGT